MRKNRKYRAFSLTEVLLSVGTLAVGMLFIAGVFPVGIHFTTVATERTIAAVVADEAFAKIRLYGITDFNSPPWPANPTIECNDFNNVSSFPLNLNEFTYPSVPGINISQKQYSWSALCRRVELNSPLVQVTVFVCRKIGAGGEYRSPADPINLKVSYPMPVKIPVPLVSGNLLTIEDGKENWINDGYTIVDNETGQIYRVLERDADVLNRIVLDRNWQGGDSVWVVPPPPGGGRYPCIAVYQKLIRF